MDGFIILDKPTGMTSRRAGATCAKIFGAKTFGHIGTLDPMASGLLLIALGSATKMIPYLEQSAERRAQSEDKLLVDSCKLSSNLKLSTSTLCALRSDNFFKEYLFGVQFGFETDTLDITGRQKAEGKRQNIPTKEEIVSVLPKLIGESLQVPPQYSAVHVGGRRAYESARRGINVEIPPRSVHIYELELLGATTDRRPPNGESWQFRVVCSPGTYVRSIARDMAAICGTLGTVDMIRRVATNGFDIKDAVPLDFLENLYNNGGAFKEYLKDVDFGLGDIPVWNLNDNDAVLFANGGFIGISQKESGISLRRVYCNDKFIGIGYLDNGELKPKRIITSGE